MMQRIGTLVKRFLSEEDGQGTVEYIFLLGVIALGILVAGYAFVKPFQGGVNDIAKKFKDAISSGKAPSAGKGLL